MSEFECACGAVGRIVPAGGAPPHREGDAAVIRWQGGRIGFGRVAVENVRKGETACPACQHRKAVFMVSA